MAGFGELLLNITGRNGGHDPRKALLAQLLDSDGGTPGASAPATPAAPAGVATPGSQPGTAPAAATPQAYQSPPDLLTLYSELTDRESRAKRIDTGLGLIGASSNGAIGDSYTIRKGDTLSGIAKKSGLSLNSILAMNPNISDPNRIMAGSSLNLGTLVPTNESLPGSSTPLYRRAGAPLPKVPARNGGFISGPPSQRYEKAVKRAERFTNLDQFGNII